MIDLDEEQREREITRWRVTVHALVARNEQLAEINKSLEIENTSLKLALELEKNRTQPPELA
jgi:hypothetical protein